MDVRTGDRVQLRNHYGQWWDVVKVLDVQGVPSAVGRWPDGVGR